MQIEGNEMDTIRPKANTPRNSIIIVKKTNLCNQTSLLVYMEKLEIYNCDFLNRNEFHPHLFD